MFFIDRSFWKHSYNLQTSTKSNIRALLHLINITSIKIIVINIYLLKIIIVNDLLLREKIDYVQKGIIVIHLIYFICTLRTFISLTNYPGSKKY